MDPAHDYFHSFFSESIGDFIGTWYLGSKGCYTDKINLFIEINGSCPGIQYFVRAAIVGRLKRTKPVFPLSETLPQ
jgi:hypothetical protein